ncbi:MAG: hydantoinase/carbamoylase family amidase [Pseudomonadota bacterium]|nr:hydantoinase/carbamoylase family amidase [Pseudomonadota bacterium]
MIGPRALAGTLHPAALDLTDADGISIAEAMAGFGGSPDQLPTLRRRPDDVLGFVEVHIEQGPVLENAGLALGTVTGICGIERNAIVFTGETGHAGTMPMAGRKDALVAASRFISGINALAQEQGDVRATVGTLSLAPGAVNAIPKRVELVLELRAIDDAQRHDMHDAARALAAQSAAAMGCGISFERTYSQDAVLCDPELRARVADAVTATQSGTGFDLPSGATHDASAMSDLCPVAMMFVRCRGGVSHRPDEFVTDADMALAVDALDHLLAGL